MELDWTQIYHECQFSSQRSRGPGGQHVNRTASAAMIHWSLKNTTALNEQQKHLLFLKLKNHLNNEGEVFVRSDVHRELERNKNECWQKLKTMILRGLHQPKPRKKTRPTKSSQARRLEGKSIRSAIKAGRKKVDVGD